MREEAEARGVDSFFPFLLLFFLFYFLLEAAEEGGRDRDAFGVRVRASVCGGWV